MNFQITCNKVVLLAYIFFVDNSSYDVAVVLTADNVKINVMQSLAPFENLFCMLPHRYC